MALEIFEQQLDAVLVEFAAFSAKSKHDDLSDLPKADRQALITRAIAAIHRISGTSSIYAREVERLLKTLNHLHMHTTSVMGVVKALRDDLKGGYIRSLVELVHSASLPTSWRWLNTCARQRTKMQQQ